MPGANTRACVRGGGRGAEQGVTVSEDRVPLTPLELTRPPARPGWPGLQRGCTAHPQPVRHVEQRGGRRVVGRADRVPTGAAELLQPEQRDPVRHRRPDPGKCLVVAPPPEFGRSAVDQQAVVAAPAADADARVGAEGRGSQQHISAHRNEQAGRGRVTGCSAKTRWFSFLLQRCPPSLVGGAAGCQSQIQIQRRTSGPGSR